MPGRTDRVTREALRLARAEVYRTHPGCDYARATAAARELLRTPVGEKYWSAAGQNLDRMVTVCDKCLKASCWHGIWMCDEARYAGTVDKPVSELLALGREHPDYFSQEAVARNCS